MNSRIINRISDERGWHPLYENEAILKNIFQNFQAEFSKNYVFAMLTTVTLLAVECFSYQVNGINVLYKKITCYF